MSAWAYLKTALAKDDLFLRVLFFFFGTAIGGFGVWLGTMCLNEWSAAEWPILVFGIAIGTAFVLWSVLLFGRALAKPSSRWSKLAEKFHPDAVDGEGIVILLVLVLLPAVLVTLILRSLGVKGLGH